jgi:HEAT repeat protein
MNHREGLRTAHTWCYDLHFNHPLPTPFEARWCQNKREGGVLMCRFRVRLAALFLMALPVMAIEVPRGLDDCPSLEACLQLIDQVVPAHDSGEGSNAIVLANKLRRFGDSAKHELLKRATGDNPGWRNVAGAILSEWHSWTPSDVPELREALRKDPGGWVARPLGEIATPEAIQALIEDLPKGSENQTDFALSKIGRRAVPYLFPVLESDENAPSAARIIREMNTVAVPFASQWATQAADPQQPVQARLGALRGIAAIGDKAQPSCEVLRNLVHDPDPRIRKQVELTLRSVRDPTEAEEVVRTCHPSAAPFDPLALEALKCLGEIASYGDGGRDVGVKLLAFLGSENGTERSYAVTALGQIGFEPAIPQIEDAMNSPDWRVVYAAIRSLGWLGDTSAVPVMERIASEYWLPEVQAQAKRVAGVLSSVGRVSRPSRFSRPSENGDNHFAINREVLTGVSDCPSKLWQWKDTSFRFPKRSYDGDTELLVQDGKFVGTNHGEWGGELVWRPAIGEPESIEKDNVVGIEPDADGPIVLFGLAHMGLAYGYAVHITRANGETWKAVEVARLPAEAGALVTIGPRLFAAWSDRRVVVFSASRGILGLATCEAH